MISVAEAKAALLSLIGPLETEWVALTEAHGRVLSQDLAARRRQPPFDASAMDGYALKSVEVAPGSSFAVIGEAAAGHRFEGRIGPGEALRIFTGGVLPEGADRVVIQEDVHREGSRITLAEGLDTARHVRPAGADFEVGATIAAPLTIRPADVALMAAMNIDRVPVTRRPTVAILPTGDELVQPGEEPGPDQIVASNSYGLAAMMAELGARPRLLPIARDTLESLTFALDLARGAELLVTIGGASVGDHDLVAPAAARLGLEQSFYKVAMRPGKPLMAGRMGQTAMVGLPGNPVSAMVCGHVFLAPMVRRMLGLTQIEGQTQHLPLSAPAPENGPRMHYMRGVIEEGTVRVAERQDSSLLTVLSGANALVIRPPDDPARSPGDLVEVLPI